jgi:hypothetical protein
MGVREIVLALVVMALLGLGLEAATADEPEPAPACISAIGPVDASGRGDTTPDRAGDCPAGPAPSAGEAP